MPILASAVTARGWHLSRSVQRRLVRTLLIAWFVAEVAAFVITARRYAVTSSGSAFYFLHPEWSGPVPELVLLTAFVGAAAGVAVTVWRQPDPVAS